MHLEFIFEGTNYQADVYWTLPFIPRAGDAVDSHLFTGAKITNRKKQGDHRISLFSTVQKICDSPKARVRIVEFITPSPHEILPVVRVYVSRTK
jgi:hypothetical protein